MILCVVCKTNESMVQKGPGAPLCRTCRAEVVLTAPDPKLALSALDALFAAEEGKVTMSVTIENTAIKAMARAIKCERCGRPEVYTPTEKKTSFFCDECGKHLCRDCAAACSHKDFAGTKILCTNCRAEKSLTGQPVEETIRDLPEGQEKKREPQPHCGRTTCIGQPGDPDPWCDCACKKCRAAVGSGHPAPMFGKMTPDPDPEPEKAESEDDEVKETSHCGTATCIDDPEKTAHKCPTPDCDHPPMCECRCPQCVKAILNKNIEPINRAKP